MRYDRHRYIEKACATDETFNKLRHLTRNIDMCLAIPMQVTAIEGHLARCNARGVEREVSLFLLQDESISVGDCVLVHVGYAIQKTTADEARSAWELFDQILASDDAARGA